MSDIAMAGIGCRFAGDADEQVAKYLEVVAAAAFPQPNRTGRAGTPAHDTSRLTRIRAELSAMDVDARGPAVTRMLTAELAEIMRVAPDSIDATVPVSDLGLDSLMAVELGARISRTFGIELVSLQTGRSFNLAQAGTKLAALILAGDASAAGENAAEPDSAAAESATQAGPKLPAAPAHSNHGQEVCR
ncbi:acyl carrier protein [Nocardia mexicana]|uniref:Phosphopantetheine binding protein n=1 Tax=Nocardia mexicana TaxID=279262 RepID=A0A370GMI4_9NOCA|nr:acyl carrier protein [Nocardia mexicana]RDI44486.1 phosphopantetheine binding protein [Nocardia mexicana]